MLSVLAPWPGLEHSTFLSVLFFWRIGALGAVHAPGFCLSVNKVCQQDPCWKDMHFEMCSAATTQTIDLPPWSKYPLLAHNFIALSAMNFSAREQLWSPLRNKGWPGIHFILAKKGINPVSRHHPSANKNWFHLIFLFYDDLPCSTNPIFAVFVLFLTVHVWLATWLSKKKTLQININNFSKSARTKWTNAKFSLEESPWNQAVFEPFRLSRALSETTPPLPGSIKNTPGKISRNGKLFDGSLEHDQPPKFHLPTINFWGIC